MLSDIVSIALTEDAPWGDVTSEYTIPDGVVAAGAFVPRAAGVMSGASVVKEVFSQVDAGVSLDTVVSDGMAFEPGETLMSVSGDARSLLRAERVALNFLQRACGVATLTAAFVEAVAGTDAMIVDTRKTTPGLRAIEKAAVVHGGGRNHRFSLSDAVLVKDNHLSAIGGIDALDAIRSKLPHLMKMEVEIDSLEQVQGALRAGADSVLCDNFSLDDLSAAVALIDGRALVNASGGVSLSTVRAIAETGVDLISVGALTPSVKAIDIGLDFEP